MTDVKPEDAEYACALADITANCHDKIQHVVKHIYGTFGIRSDQHFINDAFYLKSVI